MVFFERSNITKYLTYIISFEFFTHADDTDINTIETPANK